MTLDLGSLSSGYAYGIDGKLEKYGKFVVERDKENDDHGFQLLKFSRWLSRLINGLQRKPDVVVIEMPYLARNPNTFKVLSKFLGSAEREIRRILKDDVEIQMITASRVKQVLSPKKGKTHKERKINMIKRVNSLTGLDLRYHSNKSHTQDDVADAIALFFTYFKDLEKDK